MYQVGETVSGNILVEMTPRECEAVSHLFRIKVGYTSGLGDELVRYRKRHGLTQAEMGQMLDISKSYVSQIERGLTGNVSMAIRQRIIALLQPE